MTIYFLRHEDRPMNDSTFHTELTEKGKFRAETVLKNHLLKLNIHKVYCSPFIRCQQTIHPFIKETGLEVNVENCLQEVFWDPKFKEYPNAELSSDEEQFYNVNKKYVPLMRPNTLYYPESDNSVKNRIKKFSDYIKSSSKDQCNNILLCSHMSPVNFLINEFGENFDRKMMDQYDMGKISTIKGEEIIYIN